MILKINRYTFNVTNKDWILDNGACYQCMTLKHKTTTMPYHIVKEYPTIMSKIQFNKLLKENKIIDITDYFHNKHYKYLGCKIWKFNVGEE